MPARRRGVSSRTRTKVLTKKKLELVPSEGEAANETSGATPTGPEEDFFPPGFEDPELPPVKESDLVTYFLQTDKRGFEPYEKHATRYLHSGYRAVLVGPPTFVFDKPVAKLVGRVRGDHFQRAVAWAKSDVVQDLHNRYKLAGGGTPKEREQSVKRYLKAKATLEAHLEKLVQLEREVEDASVGLLLRFGKGPLVIEGETYDPSYVRERVYWKKRNT